jgi:hypothetical protein
VAELEASLAEGTPAAHSIGRQYPTAPVSDAPPPEPPLSPVVLTLLGTVVAVVVFAWVVA